jgi:hypothetical protein
MTYTGQELVVDLPTTPESFEQLIDVLVAKFDLPKRDHAVAVTANRIMHLPVDQDTTTWAYLGSCVKKNMAYQVAQAAGKNTAHRTQIDELVSIIKNEPNNMQAIDALDKAANDGSTYAKEALEKLNLELNPTSNVTPITGETTSELPLTNEST